MKIMNRRAFVGAMAATGAAMLAGCTPETKTEAPADARALPIGLPLLLTAKSSRYSRILRR